MKYLLNCLIFFKIINLIPFFLNIFFFKHTHIEDTVPKRVENGMIKINICYSGS